MVGWGRHFYEEARKGGGQEGHKGTARRSRNQRALAGKWTEKLKTGKWERNADLTKSALARKRSRAGFQPAAFAQKIFARMREVGR
jgi:hypothetical protein